MGAFSGNGNPKAHLFGFKENVRALPFPLQHSDDALLSLVGCTIIEDIRALCQDGQASMGYFYIDFRNVNKACMTYSLPFSPNFLLTRVTAAIFYPVFIELMTAERCSLVTLF
jgi:hypothetical protein